MQTSSRRSSVYLKSQPKLPKHNDKPPKSCTHARNTLCLKNDTDIAHYNLEADQPILIIFGRDVAERIHYQKLICCPTSPN